MEAVKKNAKESGKKSTLLKILSRIKKYWFYLAVSLILTIVTVAGTLYLPILTGRAIDQIIEKGITYPDSPRCKRLRQQQ